MTIPAPATPGEPSRCQELKALVALTLVLFPALTATVISLYGLVIWLVQNLTGVAGH